MSSDVHERLAELHVPYPYGSKRQRRLEHVRRTGVLFIHIPKNAGTSLTRALYGMDVGHETIRYFRRCMPQLAGLPSFAILRDPVRRFLSAYHYARAGGSDLRHVARGFRDTYMRLGGIDEALDHIDRAGWPYGTDHIFRPQAWYVTDRYGMVAVDHLFRLEDMQRVRNFVTRYTATPIGHANAGSAKDHAPALRPDQVARICQIYHMDYALIASAGLATHKGAQARWNGGQIDERPGMGRAFHA